MQGDSKLQQEQPVTFFAFRVAQARLIFSISMAMTTTTPLTINVGGQQFTTLASTLNQSPVFAKLRSTNWDPSACQVDGLLLIDRNSFLFEHILEF